MDAATHKRPGAHSVQIGGSVHLARRAADDPGLGAASSHRARFGASYDRDRTEVRCWIPTGPVRGGA